jgi:serine O-acetyltransferase
MKEVSSLIPDWTREDKALGEWNPGKSLLASIRTYQKCRDGQALFAFIRKQ